MSKPPISPELETSQRWKNICDAIAEDILHDDEAPGIPDDAVGRTRKQLADLTKAALKGDPLRRGDLMAHYCEECRRTTIHSIVSLVDLKRLLPRSKRANRKAFKIRCHTCHTYHHYMQRQTTPEEKESRSENESPSGTKRRS